MGVRSLEICCLFLMLLLVFQRSFSVEYVHIAAAILYTVYAAVVHVLGNLSFANYYFELNS